MSALAKHPGSVPTARTGVGGRVAAGFAAAISAMARCAVIAAAGLATAVAPGCDRGAPDRVVVYTSVDQPVAEPILRDFERQTGIKVELRTDTEAAKSVGLAERLRAEADRPRADVWWGNEVFHTVSLAGEGLLVARASAAVDAIPEAFRDPNRRWAGNGLRARVIAVHTGQDGTGPQVNRLVDLLRPELKGRIAMARPTAGTTGGHVAAIYARLGETAADAFFAALHAQQVMLLGGNSVVAAEVGRGTAIAGLTDNDDVTATIAAGGRLRSVLPDQQPAAGDDAAMGTLAIPLTVGVVRGAPNPAAAARLADYLLSAEVEKRLIDAGFAAYSVRQGPQGLSAMSVDYAKVAAILPQATRRALDLLEGKAVPRAPAADRP